MSDPEGDAIKAALRGPSEAAANPARLALLERLCAHLMGANDQLEAGDLEGYERAVRRVRRVGLQLARFLDPDRDPAQSPAVKWADAHLHRLARRGRS